MAFATAPPRRTEPPEWRTRLSSAWHRACFAVAARFGRFLPSLGPPSWAAPLLRGANSILARAASYKTQRRRSGTGPVMAGESKADRWGGLDYKLTAGHRRLRFTVCGGR